MSPLAVGNHRLRQCRGGGRAPEDKQVCGRVGTWVDEKIALDGWAVS